MPKSKITLKSKTKGTKLAYTFISDILFKMFFVKHPELLKRLIAVLLSIPLESIEHFQIINTEMPAEEIDKKFCRLDIHMIVNGSKVNLEIQVENQGDYIERSMFHWAKMFASALPAGDDYSRLPQAIVISILDFALFDCKEVHSQFAVMETNRHEILSDKQYYHFFELSKMPNIDFIDTTSERDLWLALFNAKTEEELKKLKTCGGELMGKAIEAYNGITATEEFRYLHWLRERTKHDEAQALYNAKRLATQAERQKWQGIVAEKDTAFAQTLAEKDTAFTQTLAEKDTALAEKDTTIAEKDALIAELMAERSRSN